MLEKEHGELGNAKQQLLDLGELHEERQCTFAQHVKKTMFSEFNDFPQKRQNRYLAPRGLTWSARRPRREPRGTIG